MEWFELDDVVLVADSSAAFVFSSLSNFAMISIGGDVVVVEATVVVVVIVDDSGDSVAGDGTEADDPDIDVDDKEADGFPSVD